METRFDDSELSQHLEGLLLDIYLWHLEIDDRVRCASNHTLLAEEGDDLDEFEEWYELPHPEFFTCDLQFENAILNNVRIGDIQVADTRVRKSSSSKTRVRRWFIGRKE